MVRRYELLSYFVFAYLFSWVIAVPLALQRAGVIETDLPYALHYLTAYGPMLSALLVTWRLGGRAGVAGFLQRGFRRLSGGWFLFSLLSPLLFLVPAAAAAAARGGGAAYLRGLGQVNFLPYLGIIAWGLWLSTSGLGEEVGWRGFALPRLQQRYGLVRAALLLGLPWAGWHVPALFYLPNLMALGIFLPGFLLGILAGSLLFAWLYQATGGSILAVVLWHGTLNFVTASAAGAGLTGMVSSMVVMAAAIVIAVRYRARPRAPVRERMGA